MVALVAGLPQAAWAVTSSDLCEAAKLAAVGKLTGCHLDAIGKAVRSGTPPDTDRCTITSTAKLAGIDQRHGDSCPVRQDGATLDAHVRARVAAMASRFAPPPLTGLAAICAAAKLAHASDLAVCRAKREARALQRGTPADTVRCDERAAAAFARAERAFGTACPTHDDAGETSGEIARLTGAIRLNVIVIYLDDIRSDVLAHMPAGMAPNLERLADEGVVFTNAFAPTPICAQSRATLLTGLRMAGGVRGGHGVRTLASIASFTDDVAIGTWFTAAERDAGLFGKYINGYTTPGFDVGGGRMYVPPGWSSWLAVRSNEYYGGLFGATWYGVDLDGTQTEYRGCCSRRTGWGVCYQNDPACLDDQTYQTDILSAALQSYVADRAQAGWLAVMSPSAGHGGHALFPDPAARHVGTLAGLPPWRPVSHAAPIVDVPPHFPFDPMPLPVFPQPNFTDAMRMLSLETLLAVDEAVGELLDTLQASGELDRTAIVLSSDNGVTYGEHALWSMAKACAYEECQRVPIIVRMPDAVHRVVDEPVLVTDLAPTVAALARVQVPIETDGRSFEPMLRGAAPPAPWRTDYCVELDQHVPQWVGYRGVRDVAGGFTYVEYFNGSVELFDLTADPAQLVNVAGEPAYAAEQTRLAQRVGELCS